MKNFLESSTILQKGILRPKSLRTPAPHGTDRRTVCTSFLYLVLPLLLQPSPLELVPHHYTKTSLVKVTSDLHDDAQ